MSEWKRIPFNQVASFSYGKMPKKDLLGKGEFQTYSGYKYLDKYPEYNCDADDLIVVARGVGGSGDVKLVNRKCYLTNLSIKFDLDQKVIFTPYLYYYFQWNNLRYLDSGSAQSQITINDLSKVELTLPPLPEQKAIASVLSSLDDKIDLLHRQNKTLEAMAETLFRQWFIEEAKEDWEDISLNDILTTVSGYVRKPTDKDGDDKLLSMGVVSQNFGINDSACKPIDAADIPQQHKVSLYDLIISTRDVTQDAIFLGAPAIIPSYRKSENLYIGANLFKLQLINKNFGKWNLYCLLRSSPFREYVKDVASGTSILMLKKSDFLQYTFKCPDPNVLTDINSKLAILFNKIDNNLTNLMTLKKLRDTLLPKLMSGEVRVQIKEESAA